MSKYTFLLAFILVIIACQSPTLEQTTNMTYPIDIQGHRGARGLYPENSLEGFKYALELGVNTLELDVVISKDSQIVVSHEAVFNHEICLKPNGDTMTLMDQKKSNLYALNYDEIKQYDCGSLGNPNFPEQQKLKTFKPTLKMVFDLVATHLIEHENAKPVYFNIETKSKESGDGIYHPNPTEFSRILLEEINKYEAIKPYVTIQSFDTRTLEAVHQMDSTLTTALLIYHNDPEEHDFEKNLATLSFKPSIYSCYFPYVDESLINEARQKNIKVIPWTANEPEDIKRLISVGVDGIISDYPKRVMDILDELQNPTNTNSVDNN